MDPTEEQLLLYAKDPKSWYETILPRLQATAVNLPHDSLERSYLTTIDNIVHGTFFIATTLWSLVERSGRFEYLQGTLDSIHVQDNGLVDLISRYLSNLSTADSLMDAVKVRSIKNLLLNFFEIVENLRTIIHAIVYEMHAQFELEIVEELRPEGRQLVHYLEELCRLRKMTEALVPKAQQSCTDQISASSKANFQYNGTLSSESGEIRIILLHSRTDSEILSCDLFVQKLSESEPFVALSYVWGTEIARKPLSLNGFPFIITANLRNALLALRRETSTVLLWADAISINQQDNAERSSQVRMMSQIYSSAIRTEVWLGDIPESLADVPPGHHTQPTCPENSNLKVCATNSSRADLGRLLSIYETHMEGSRENHMRLKVYAQLLHCLYEMLGCAWWTRIWVIQELVLSRGVAILHFGCYTFSWTQLVRCIDIIFGSWACGEFLPAVDGGLDDESMEISALLREIQRRGSQATIRYHMTFISIDREVNTTGNRKRPFRSIKHALVCATNSQSTDPRDKVFALASLLPKDVSGLLAADYTLTTFEIFQRTSAQTLSTVDSMALYQRFQRLSTTSILTCPSWILDFSSSRTDPFKEKTGIGSMEAKLWSQQVWGSSDDPQDKSHFPFATAHCLHCYGIDIDTIFQIGEIPDFLPDTASSTSDVNLSYQKYQDWMESLCRLQLGCLLNQTSPHSSLAELIALMPVYKAATMSYHYCPEGETDDEIILFFQDIKRISGNYFFMTNKGAIGIATEPVLIGDCLVALLGCNMPFVLRPTGDSDRFSIVVEARVEGIAKGQLLPLYDQGLFPLRSFTLV